MKAIIIEKFGGVGTLTLSDQPIPQAKAGEVQIKVMVAGVNPVDVKIREGLLAERMPYHFPITLGWDLSGVVSQLGEGVSDFKVGDEVFAYARQSEIHAGTYAEYISLPASQVVMKPKSVDWFEAASYPLAALTAYQVLHEALKVQSGESIVIHAGGGGVGGFAIQLAKLAGLDVITTASEKHYDYVKSLGADEVIDYQQMSPELALMGYYPLGVNCVFDTVGGETQKQSAALVREGGRLASILQLEDTKPFEEKNIQTHYVFVRPEKNHLETIAALIDQGKLKTRIAAVFPLEKAKAAHELIQMGHTQGKIVINVAV